MTKGEGSKKKAAEALNKSVQKREKGATSISYVSTKGTYRIRCAHYARRGEAGKEKIAGGYQTEAQAKSEEQLFAFAVRTGGARGVGTIGIPISPQL